MATNQFGQTFSGNDDYRGYLAANGQSALLPYVGNDGGFNSSRYNSDRAGQASGLGLTGSAQLPNISADQNAQLYANYLNARSTPTDLGGGGLGGDPNTAAFYDDQTASLERQLPGLDRQQEIGLGNIDNSYNQGVNRLNEQKGVAERDYGTNKDKNVNSYLDNRNGIMSNTRATANSLQRLLGMNGAGFSSASQEQAPYAAALQGSQSLTGAQKTYGGNEATLATAWDDTLRGYKNSNDDLNNQKFQQTNSLKSSIAQTRAGLLDKISQGKTQAGLARGQSFAAASAGKGAYQSQIDALLSQITENGNQYANPVFQTGDVKYAAPTQSQFSLDKFAAPTNLNGAQSDLSPTFLGLLAGQNKERDNYGNLIG